MPNTQLYPQSTFPLAGDVESQTGNPDVTVTGIQGTPFASTKPTAGQVPVMNSDGSWHPEDPVVSGPDATGDSPSKPPVQIGGIDDGNRVRELRVDSSGTLVSTNIEQLLQAILHELKKQTLILESATSDSFENESLGDM